MAKPADTIQWAEMNWFPVRYGFCPSRKAWDRFMKKNGTPGWAYPTTGGMCTAIDTKHGKWCLVTVDDIKRPAPWSPLLILVHEAVHVKQVFVEHMGERNVGIEFEAYAIQHISAFLIDAYTKTRGKKP